MCANLRDSSRTKYISVAFVCLRFFSRHWPDVGGLSFHQVLLRDIVDQVSAVCVASGNAMGHIASLLFRLETFSISGLETSLPSRGHDESDLSSLPCFGESC